MTDYTAYASSSALHAALVAALVASPGLASAGVALPGGVVVGPQRGAGRALPYVIVESETLADAPAYADADARAAETTRTLRVFASTDAAARRVADAAALAALSADPEGFVVVRASVDLVATGPGQDLSPVDGSAPVGDRIVRLRYTLSPAPEAATP